MQANNDCLKKKMIGYEARHVCRVKICFEAAVLQPGLEKVGRSDTSGVGLCRVQISLVRGTSYSSEPTPCSIG